MISSQGVYDNQDDVLGWWLTWVGVGTNRDGVWVRIGYVLVADGTITVGVG